MTMMTSNNLPGLNYFITVMISLALGIGFLVIFLSMYTTITERTREIGILKSLGASKTYIHFRHPEERPRFSPRLESSPGSWGR